MSALPLRCQLTTFPVMQRSLAQDEEREDSTVEGFVTEWTMVRLAKAVVHD